MVIGIHDFTIHPAIRMAQSIYTMLTYFSFTYTRERARSTIYYDDIVKNKRWIWLCLSAKTIDDGLLISN